VRRRASSRRSSLRRTTLLDARSTSSQSRPGVRAKDSGSREPESVVPFAEQAASAANLVRTIRLVTGGASVV
jgi:hypothetical protein